MIETEEIKWLYGLGINRWKLGLENITFLMNKLGNPQNEFKTVHVAGSDGKGSTSAMIHSILMKNGFKTGLYTSPHVVRFNERIRIDRNEITDAELSKYIAELKPIVEEMKLRQMNCTFFEVTTAIAFLYFRDEKVDYAVIEVGLGGRFDATNVIFPEISAITNVSMEHKDVLGKTLDKIAYEKSGIVKKYVPVVTSNEGIALKVIEKTAKENNSRLTKTETVEILETAEKKTVMKYCGETYEVSISGDYQAKNAAVAIEVARILKLDKIKEGLSSVEWKYRMEKIDGKPIVVDVSHTAAGAEAMTRNIEKIYGKVAVVFGMLNDKDAKNFAKYISKISVKTIVVTPESDRAMSPEKIMSATKESIPDATYEKSFDNAMQSAIDTGKTVLVTGSFLMASAAEEWLRRNRWLKTKWYGYWTRFPKNTKAERIQEGLPKV